MIYLAPTTDVPADFGIIFTPNKTIGGLEQALDGGRPWMLDNGAFTGKFDTSKWVQAMLSKRKFAKTCVGVVIPDAVGDALATLRMFSQYWRIVKDLDYPVAFCSQDGITPEITPWDYLDVLFVGGSDEHKLGMEAGAMIAEAKARDKWVHIGRVNSHARIKQFWMADSCDGTMLIKQNTAARQQLLSDAILYSINRKNGTLSPSGQGIFEI